MTDHAQCHHVHDGHSCHDVNVSAGDRIDLGSFQKVVISVKSPPGRISIS